MIVTDICKHCGAEITESGRASRPAVVVIVGAGRPLAAAMEQLERLNASILIVDQTASEPTLTEPSADHWPTPAKLDLSGFHELTKALTEFQEIEVYQEPKPALPAARPNRWPRGQVVTAPRRPVRINRTGQRGQ